MTGTPREPTAQDRAVIGLLWKGHLLTAHTTRDAQGFETETSCACGWAHPPTRGSLRPQWAASDAHLVSVLPAGTVTAPCWCGRLAVRAEVTGAWYHADKAFMGHGAFEGSTPPQLAS